MSTEHARISNHAKNRFIERVDPGEPYPETRIKSELGNAETVDLDGSDGVAVLTPSGILFILDEDRREVITCYEPTDEQLTEAVQ